MMLVAATGKQRREAGPSPLARAGMRRQSQHRDAWRLTKTVAVVAATCCVLVGLFGCLASATAEGNAERDAGVLAPRAEAISTSSPPSTSTNATTTTVDEERVSERQHTRDSQVLLLLLVLLLLTSLVIWKFKVKRYLFLHETGVSLIIGFLAGYFIDLATDRHKGHAVLCGDESQQTSQPQVESVEDETVFDPEIFFYVLLPPIIFYAGYDLKQKHFFRNLGVILLFAFLGTTVVCFVTGGMLLFYSKFIAETPLNANDSFLFGALISATDPVTVLAIFNDLHVDDRLYAMVFGESVLNDAVAIVLYRSIAEYKPELNHSLTPASFFYSVWVFVLILFGSLACGMVVAMFSSALFKFSEISRYPLLETAMFVMLSYSAFLMGEGFGLSGIVSILFCGIGQAHYTFPCLSDEAKKRTVDFFQLLNFLAENFVFSYIGINFFTFKCHKWNPGFIAWAVFAVLASRLVHIFPMSWIANKFRRKKSQNIPYNFQFMMWWAGLRGAVAFALAMQNTATAAHQTILSTTLVIVVITVICFGGSTEYLLNLLKIPRVGPHAPADADPHAGERHKPPKGWLAEAWQGLDARFIRPAISITDNNMHGTSTWSEVKTTVSNFFAGRPQDLRHLESPVLDGEGADNDDDDDDDDDEQLSLGGFNPELPPGAGQGGALSGDFTSFATWNEPSSPGSRGGSSTTQH